MKIFIRILVAIFLVAILIDFGVKTFWWAPMVLLILGSLLSVFLVWLFKKDHGNLEMDGIRGDFYYREDNSIGFKPDIYGKFVIRQIPEQKPDLKTEKKD